MPHEQKSDHFRITVERRNQLIKYIAGSAEGLFYRLLYGAAIMRYHAALSLPDCPMKKAAFLLLFIFLPSYYYLFFFFRLMLEGHYLCQTCQTTPSEKGCCREDGNWYFDPDRYARIERRTCFLRYAMPLPALYRFAVFRRFSCQRCLLFIVPSEGHAFFESPIRERHTNEIERRHA